jgi:rhodanese-related sulfurtransferase
MSEIKTIRRDEVERLMREGAQVVEVLPEEEYMLGHLPGALNIPLPRFTADALAGLHRKRPVIVYCADMQ